MMKIKLTIIMSSIILLNTFAQNDTLIRVNSLGFLPLSNKKATIIGNFTDFVVKSAMDGSIVFSGKTQGNSFQKEFNQKACFADFSEITESGSYYIEIPNVGKSPTFEISNEVFNFPYSTVMRSFYLMRCGTAVKGTFQGIEFEHKACHMDDGWMDFTEFGTTHRNGTGGWHDAGDYGKYTVNAGITLGTLFKTWEYFGDKLAKCPLHIPDSNLKIPDFLQEIKWETDWLLKMQYPDNSGRIFHKITRTNFENFILPEKDTNKRYFSEWTSDATAQFAASMAMAARFFKVYDKKYAETCLDAAINSYNYLKLHPEYKKYNQPELQTGAYSAPDKAGRLWAAAELWETTGDTKYLSDFENQLVQFNKIYDVNWDWGNVKNLGIITYLTSTKNGKNQELVNSIKNELIRVADSIVQIAQNDIYARPFNEYYWGCNGTVARESLTLYVAHLVENKEAYEQTAINTLDHLFGRNYYGRSYVTGLGYNPPLEPHDRRSEGNTINKPWPGYIIGGGHTATDWKDEWTNFKTNEIALNWQASLLFSLAWFTSF